jgi:anti-sigma B factor antagonist
MRMPDLSFRVEMAGDVPVVVTPGDIDITNASVFRTALLEAAGRGRTFVVDMSGTQFCDTAGIHALVAAHKQARDDGGEVRLVVTSASVLRIFAITGFDQVISRFSRLDQALAAP